MNIPEIRFIIFKHDDNKLKQIGHKYPICINRLKNTNNLNEDVTDYVFRLNAQHLKAVEDSAFGHIVKEAHYWIGSDRNGKFI